MKIAVIVPSLRHLAPVQVALSLADHLANAGHEVTVYYFSESINEKHFKSIKCQKIHFLSRIPWSEYDIVHSHGFLPDAFVATRKRGPHHMKSVSTIHNYVFADLSMLYNGMVSKIVGKAWVTCWKKFDHLVVLTDDAKNYYQALLPGKSISRIYNGKNMVPHDDAVLPEHRLLAEVIRKKYTYCIGTTAALISRKRIDILIRHLSRVKTGGLLILGEGREHKPLADLVVKLELLERVKFLGYVQQAHAYHGIFDISAHPSISEGFSLALIEAAGYQKKIVCSDIPAFREAFTNEEVTFFNSSDELTIDQAIQDAWLNEEKPKKAFLKATTLYTEERMTSDYTSLFQQLLSPSSDPS